MIHVPLSEQEVLTLSIRKYSSCISAISLIEDAGHEISLIIKNNIIHTHESLVNSGFYPHDSFEISPLPPILERCPNYYNILDTINLISESGFGGRQQCMSGIHFTNYYIFRLYDLDDDGDYIFIKIRIDTITNVITKIECVFNLSHLNT